MTAEVYKQAFDYDLGFNNAVEIDVSKDDLERGFTKIDCPDCDGTGVFQLPEGSCKCRNCKGTGERPVSLI